MKRNEVQIGSEVYYRNEPNSMKTPNWYPAVVVAKSREYVTVVRYHHESQIPYENLRPRDKRRQGLDHPRLKDRQPKGWLSALPGERKGAWFENEAPKHTRSRYWR